MFLKQRNTKGESHERVNVALSIGLLLLAMPVFVSCQERTSPWARRFFGSQGRGL